MGVLAKEGWIAGHLAPWEAVALKSHVFPKNRRQHPRQGRLMLLTGSLVCLLACGELRGLPKERERR